jgi:hypothetical protein
MLCLDDCALKKVLAFCHSFQTYATVLPNTLTDKLSAGGYDRTTNPVHKTVPIKAENIDSMSVSYRFKSITEDNGNNWKYSGRGIYSKGCYPTSPQQLILDKITFKNQNVPLHTQQLEISKCKQQRCILWTEKCNISIN